MRLALVIPALNEEQAIAGTLRRALAARAKVIAQTPVKEMVIVFVNDGCTDRTQQIVDQPEFNEVVKVNYGRNRGYGAAIKAGFLATDCDLVGFMDADGTCEPDFCINLINALVDQKADVVLARRLEANTEMPMIRKVGNRIFATLLGVMSGHTDITDTASGFRIIKRDSLKLMSPLPDGLHYTPAMSCICLLDPRLKIVEVAGMHYKEREGRSKLKVIRDGFRFLWTILFSAACYSPVKTMSMGTGLMLAVMIPAIVLLALTVGSNPAIFAGLTTLLLTLIFLATGVAVHQLNFLLIGPRRNAGAWEHLLQNALDYHKLIVGGALLTVLSLTALLVELEFNLTGSMWTWASLLMLAVIGGTAICGGVVVRVIWAVGEKQHALIADEYRVKTNQPTPRPQPMVKQAMPESGKPHTAF